MTISVIGLGFVGKAVASAFPNVEIIGIDPKVGPHDISVLKNRDDVLAHFVCVPTPMRDDGSIDSTIITTVVEYLSENTTGLIIVKSTVTPDVINELASKTDGRFVYNPEFLTEANASHEFRNPAFHVLGSFSRKTSQSALRIYRDFSNVDTSVPAFFVQPAEASFIKYGLNSFLATKVLWLNEFKDLIDSFQEISADDMSQESYGRIVEAMKADPRFGTSHTSVPGPDGKRGFGGACFTKDTNAFLAFAKKFGSPLETLNTVVSKNIEYRSAYDLDSREKEQNVSYKV